MGGINEAEQNRLIIENMYLAQLVASAYRGAKTIPFEDLQSAARLGLTKAARNWQQLGEFRNFAAQCMHNELKAFIRRWQELSQIGDEPEIERYFWEWSIWPWAVPYEGWISLAATPEEIVSSFEEVAKDRRALTNAMLFLDHRARKILGARFFRVPRQSLESIAREHKISHSRVTAILKSSLESIRKNIDGQKRKVA